MDQLLQTSSNGQNFSPLRGGEKTNPKKNNEFPFLFHKTKHGNFEIQETNPTKETISQTPKIR
jgi:hypothetical protein